MTTVTLDDILKDYALETEFAAGMNASQRTIARYRH